MVHSQEILDGGSSALTEAVAASKKQAAIAMPRFRPSLVIGSPFVKSTPPRVSKPGERRRVLDLAFDALHGSRHQFDRHEFRSGERRPQPTRHHRREAEPGIELGVPEDDDDPMSRLLAGPEPFPYQGRADPPPLVRRDDRQRSQGQGVDLPAGREDWQLAEQDVADDLSLDFGDCRDPEISLSPQVIDQSSFVLSTERQPVDFTDGVEVGWLLGSYRIRGVWFIFSRFPYQKTGPTRYIEAPFEIPESRGFS